MQLLTKNGIKIETVTVTDHTISGLNYSVLMGEVNRHRPKTFSKLNHLKVKRNSGLKYKHSVRLSLLAFHYISTVLSFLLHVDLNFGKQWAGTYRYNVYIQCSTLINLCPAFLIVFYMDMHDISILKRNEKGLKQQIHVCMYRSI